MTKLRFMADGDNRFGPEVADFEDKGDIFAAEKTPAQRRRVGEMWRR